MPPSALDRLGKFNHFWFLSPWTLD
uniref:Uncharacterized protein n=1 Tax=Arundo donax TaxID=35708 RepID=A0A0A8Z9B5_ARUDO